MNLNSRKVVKYTLLGIAAYIGIKFLLILLNIVFSVAFKILVLIAIIAFISYLIKK